MVCASVGDSKVFLAVCLDRPRSLEYGVHTSNQSGLVEKCPPARKFHLYGKGTAGMAFVVIFSAAYCGADELVESCAQALGSKLLNRKLIETASASAGLDQSGITRAMSGPPFVFNRYTHKRERSLAHLRLALAGLLSEESGLLHGFAAQLVPGTVGHCLRVCLIADLEHRVKALTDSTDLSPKQARRQVRESDLQRAQWTQYLFGKQPWDSSLYDIKLPLHSMSQAEAIALIVEHAGSDALTPSPMSSQAVQDFGLAARVQLALGEAGHFHDVQALGAKVTITIDEFVVRLDHLQKKLKSIATKVEGAEQVTFATGPNYRPSSVFANVDVRMPDKILLVDDEGEFVLTLSERLQMRDMQPAIARNGEEALEILRDEEPEVMILDLKMPGIDGVEVLRRVKTDHPEVEVIILTGHGSDQDRDLCMQLGAFAYLEKPVDIEVLAETMRKANDLIRDRRKDDK